MGEPHIESEHTAVTLIQDKVCVWEVNTQQFLNAKTLYIVIELCQNVMPVVLCSKFMCILAVCYLLSQLHLDIST